MYKKLIMSILVALICVAAPGSFAVNQIPMGKPTVDGDLSDWVSQNPQCPVVWYDLNQNYWSWSGDVPADVSNAKWAALWDDASNKLYMAVTGTDTAHYFADGGAGWDAKDDIEVYVDAGNREIDNYNSTWDTSQQWVVGPGTTGGHWTWLNASQATTDITAAVTVIGNVITYELEITPYWYYRGGGGTDEPESEVDLTAGETVGLEPLFCSKYSAVEHDDFGMISNIAGNRSLFKMASNFQDHVLSSCDTGIPEPATIALLGIGGLALLRRKRG